MPNGRSGWLPLPLSFSVSLPLLMGKGILLYAEILAENGLMSAADVADAFTH